MAKYQRVYSNSSEKEERFAIFRNNLKNINIFNSRGAENFTQRINSFGDLTDEEFRSRYRGSFHIPNTTTTSSSFFKYQSIKDEDLSDATVDWRRDGVVTNVKNQGECVSSWAFATVTALEGIAPYITDNKFMNLSVQQLIDCSKSFGTHGCTGGLPSDALAYVAAKGLVIENRDADGSCENSTLSHVTAVIGYGTTIRGVDYWILKNSWGKDWGENGYMRILRNPENKPAGVCNLAVYPVYPSLS
ncbi:PREDICTED: ananain-like [Fragaria vesca subsp. vesca]